MKNQGASKTGYPAGLWRVCAAGFALAIMAAGCNKITMNADWKDRDIVVDGDHIDWSNILYTIESKGVSIGVMNDSSNLYICLVPGDRSLEQQMTRGGMTLWLDSGGGKKKTFGIRYPLGMAGGMPLGGTGSPEFQGPGGDPQAGGDRGLDPAPVGGESDLGIAGDQKVFAMLEFDILGADKNDIQRMRSGQDHGISVAAGRGQGRFVYELKVPLKSSEGRAFALNAAPGSVISIGFESEESKDSRDRPEGGRREDQGGPPGAGDVMDGGGMPGGGMPGGGMGPGGRPGRGQVESMESANSLNVWLFVTLAAKSGKADM
jgi:hypothetical protein